MSPRKMCPVSSASSLTSPLPSGVLLLLLLSGISPLLGDPGNCSYKMLEKPVHYFDDFNEVKYNASCGHLCHLPVPDGMRNVTQLQVYFPVNHTRVNCSWLTPDLGDAMQSTVMFFEPSKPVSLAHGLKCGGNGNSSGAPSGSASSSLTLWDQYTDGGGGGVGGDAARITYTVCRDPAKSGLEDYSRLSSRLGPGFRTLITLTDFPVEEEGANRNPVLLKYVPVDWSDSCHTADYKQVEVGPLENTTALGSEWFTSNLRLPNGMRCKWKLSPSPFPSPSSSSISADLIRVRITVLERTSIPGPCAGDDKVQVQDEGGSSGGQTQAFTLCDQSGPFFFLSSFSSSSSSSPAALASAPVKVDFTSGSVGGSPEWQMSHSLLPACPQNRLTVESDLMENVVYGMVVPGASRQSQTTAAVCRWTLHTNWTNNVLMVTRLEAHPSSQDCNSSQPQHAGQSSFLALDLGSAPVQTVSLCQTSLSAATPLWSLGRDLHVDLNLTTSRTVSVFYKSVPKVPYCQGHPGSLEVVPEGRAMDVPVDLSLQRTHRHVSAPDCRWLVHPPMSRAADADQHVAEMTVSGVGSLWGANVTTAGWLISGFRAYAGNSVNASTQLKENCFYDELSLLCRYVSSQPSLLLVYDPSRSTSPVRVDRVNLSARQVKKVSSGQSGSAQRCWQALWLWLAVSAVVVVWKG